MEKNNNKRSKFINKKSFWAIGIVLLVLVVTSLSLYAKGHDRDKHDSDDYGHRDGKMMYMMNDSDDYGHRGGKMMYMMNDSDDHGHRGGKMMYMMNDSDDHGHRGGKMMYMMNDSDDHGRYGGKMMHMMMGMDMGMDDALEKLDANRDGTVSKQEHLDAVIAMVTDKAEEGFNKIDADNDGSITKEEFAAATEMMKKRGKYGSKKSGKY